MSLQSSLNPGRPLSGRRSPRSRMNGLFYVILASCWLVLQGCAGHGCTPDSLPDDLIISLHNSRTVTAGETTTLDVVVPGEQPAVSMSVRVEADAPLTVSPNFLGNLRPLDFEHVEVTIPSTTAPGDYQVRLINTRTGLVKNSVTITVVAASTGPDFSFTASSTTVSTVPTVFSPPVTFTLTSLGGFTGEVSIDWVEDSQLFVSDPEPKPYVVTVENGGTVTFNRRFYRSATHSNPLTATFTATGGGITKTIVITVNHGQGE